MWHTLSIQILITFYNIFLTFLTKKALACFLQILIYADLFRSMEGNMTVQQFYRDSGKV